MEAAPGFEPGHCGFADRCLTTWLRRLFIKRPLIMNDDSVFSSERGGRVNLNCSGNRIHFTAPGNDRFEAAHIVFLVRKVFHVRFSGPAEVEDPAAGERNDVARATGRRGLPAKPLVRVARH